MIDLAASNQARSACEEAQLFTLIARIFCVAMSIFAVRSLPPGLDPDADADPFPSTYRPLPNRPVAIVGAHIFTGTGGEYASGVVLINDGKIEAVGENLTPPAGYEVIDAHGEWVTPGTPILTVDDLSTIWARVDVEETDLGSLYIGKPARVRLPTNPPTYLSGRVMAIGQEGQFATEHDVRRGRQDIRTFYIKVQLLQAGDEAKPGMTAEVTFLRNDGTRLSRNSNDGPDEAVR